MRASRLVLIGVLLVSTAFPTAAPARPRIPAVLGAVIGGVAGVLGGRHRHHAYAARHAPYAAPGEQPTGVGPLYWPHLADDVVDYVFWPSGTDDRFWAFGYGDIVGGALRPASRPEPAMSRRGRPTITTASGTDVAPGPCAGQPASTSADTIITRLEEATQPTEAQRALIADLRAALQHGLDYIDTACPTDRPQSPTARLDAMEDRLWAARQTLLITRAPIEKLYASLDDEQKARLNGPQGASREATCTQVDPELPFAQFGHGTRPGPEQRAGLEALKTTSSGLAKLIAASCPSAMPATPMERLDAADRRINALLYAVVTLRAPLDGLSTTLSDAQKTSARATR
jgi:hypothetical protein